jgi:hypothetical protein
MQLEQVTRYSRASSSEFHLDLIFGCKTCICAVIVLSTNSYAA